MDRQYGENSARNIYSNYNEMSANVECSPNQSKVLYLIDLSIRSNERNFEDSGKVLAVSVSEIYQSTAIRLYQPTLIRWLSLPLRNTFTNYTKYKLNTFTNHTKYKFDQTDREVFESVLEEALGSADFSGHLSTSDLDKYADFIITALHTAVDKAIPKSKSVRPESNPISNETLALIKEKRKLRRQYSQRKDPAVKTRINQLQKQVKDLRIESQASWEKFCNSISLETDSNESWCRI